MKTKVKILIGINVCLLLAWRFFKHLKEKIDLFPSYKLEQQPKWYVFYTSLNLRELIAWLICYLLTPSHRTYLKVLFLFMIIFTFARGLVYWLFNSSLNMEVQITGIVMFLILASWKWQKSRSR